MTDIIDRIEALLEPLLEGTDIFLVRIRIKPVNNIRVYLDADNGLTIDKSAKINKQLYARMVAEALFPDDNFSLEVSSPGVDEPLTSLRQYKKNTGRTVTITYLDEQPEATGVLKEITDTGLVLELTIPKQKITTQKEIPFSSIKQTTVQIVF